MIALWSAVEEIRKRAAIKGGTDEKRAAASAVEDRADLIAAYDELERDTNEEIKALAEEKEAFRELAMEMRARLRQLTMPGRAKDVQTLIEDAFNYCNERLNALDT